MSPKHCTNTVVLRVALLERINLFATPSFFLFFFCIIDILWIISVFYSDCNGDSEKQIETLIMQSIALLLRFLILLTEII